MKSVWEVFREGLAQGKPASVAVFDGIECAADDVADSLVSFIVLGLLTGYALLQDICMGLTAVFSELYAMRRERHGKQPFDPA